MYHICRRIELWIMHECSNPGAIFLGSSWEKYPIVFCADVFKEKTQIDVTIKVHE
jgi:hypothetical protein